jgi:OOP family OmpA-OmpF porin
VRQAVIARFGLPADKVRAIGFGETMPIADNGNYQGRRLNRRVVIKVYKN